MPFPLRRVRQTSRPFRSRNATVASRASGSEYRNDGSPFEGNRYIDRFVVRAGKIVQMDVWNDSAERILTQRGIKA